MAKTTVKLGGRAVQLGAKAAGGRVAVGVAVGETVAADIVTPARAEKIAAELAAGAAKVKRAAASARRQKKPGFFRRFLPW